MDYDIFRQLNPRLVMTSISPFGQTGPHRDYNAHDLTMWSAGGIVYLGGVSGRPDMPPLKAFGQQAGFQAGVNAAVGSLARCLAGSVAAKDNMSIFPPKRAWWRSWRTTTSPGLMMIVSPHVWVSPDPTRCAGVS